MFGVEARFVTAAAAAVEIQKQGKSKKQGRWQEEPKELLLQALVVVA